MTCEEISQTCLTVEQIDPRMLKPSPENSKIYRPVDPDDPAVKDLAGNILKNDVLEPLIVTQDLYILSGHRRREAAILAGLDTVPCRVDNIRRLDDDGIINPEFMRLLTSYNQQRVKNNAELLHEAIIQADPDEAYQALLNHREKSSRVHVKTIDVGERGKRKEISGAKSEMVTAAMSVIDENKEYWPLSDRQIHYRLLNDPPLKHKKKSNSRYRNDRASYQDLCDLLTRLRLTGDIPMDAISDPTRPASRWSIYRNTQDFVRNEINGFLKNYWRDLLQTQPLHLVVVAEKMTVESIIKPVCARYTIPYVIGRGYSSLPARADIVEKFKKSGKDRLVLLILSDHDPEGVNIGETILQSLREDFGINAEAVRVGLTHDQIERFDLMDNPGEAKTSSTRYKKFVQQYGTQVYELEALSPEQLQQILTESIDHILDVEAFNAELDAEKQDAAYLAAMRRTVCRNTLDLIEGGK